jgi:hypothetical protein
MPVRPNTTLCHGAHFHCLVVPNYVKREMIAMTFRRSTATQYSRLHMPCTYCSVGGRNCVVWLLHW